MNWNSFNSRLIFTANLVAQTGLRVGAAGQAAEPAAPDLPVMKDALERPFIPGSSLRGALRSHVERIVRAFSDRAEQGKGACDPLDDKKLCVTKDDLKNWEEIEWPERLKKVEKEAGEEARRKLEQQKDEGRANWLFGKSCCICRVFGSPWLASRVRLTDLICVNGAHTEVRDGVSINREKETVEQKYDFETVPSGSRFALEIVAENLDEVERGLLWLGVEELRRGQILVGGFKGRGLGRVAITIG
jgi:CRISPR-associated protein Csm3